MTDITYDSRTFGVHVSVTDDGAGNLVADVTYDEPVAFSNSYTQTFESTSVNIQAVKTLTGRAMEDGEFSFSVIDPTQRSTVPLPSPWLPLMASRL